MDRSGKYPLICFLIWLLLLLPPVLWVTADSTGAGDGPEAVIERIGEEAGNLLEAVRSLLARKGDAPPGP